MSVSSEWKGPCPIVNSGTNDAFFATFNQAAVGMAHVGIDGSWLLVNQKLCDIVGYTKNELAKLTFQDITHPDDLTSDLQSVKKLLDGEIQSYAYEKRYIRKDTVITWVNLTVSLVKDSHGNPLYFISVIEDINLRKNSELELMKMKSELEEHVLKRTQALSMVNESLEALIKKSQKTETELNKFFQLSNDIMVITNADRTVRNINGAFEKILGYSADDFIGRRLSELIFRDDVGFSAKKSLQLESDQIVSNFENRWLAKDGSVVWLSWSYTLIKEENSIFSIARNITEAKKNEQLIADQKLKMANVSKMNSLSRMAAGVAHEINNPMMVIYGQVFLLKKFINRSANPSTYVLEGLNKIDSVAQRVKKIVNGLRAFSKDGSHDPFENVDLATLIEDTLTFCKAKLNKESIQLIIDPNISDIKVFCQPVQISQVLLNLIENSHDAIHELSSDKWIQLNIEMTDDHKNILLKVVDCGAGLDQPTTENLFQPFFTTKPVGKGTGLGLSISKSIMLLNNGDLFLDESAANTTFVMRIPLKN